MKKAFLDLGLILGTAFLTCVIIIGIITLGTEVAAQISEDTIQTSLDPENQTLNLKPLDTKNKNFKGTENEIKNLTYLYGRLDYIVEKLNRLENKCGN